MKDQEDFDRQKNLEGNIIYRTRNSIEHGGILSTEENRIRM